jgi:anti-sigma factor RsiW
MKTNCERFDETLELGDVGSLGPDAQAEFGRHLADCASCARRLRELTLTTEILKGLGRHEDQEAPPPLREPLVQRILAARRSEGTDLSVHRRA